MHKLLTLLATVATLLAADPPPVTTQTLTRIDVQWVPLRSLGPTNGVRCVGLLTTNSYALVIHDGRTNVVFLKQLGQEEWPSLRGTNDVQGSVASPHRAGVPLRAGRPAVGAP